MWKSGTKIYLEVKLRDQIDWPWSNSSLETRLNFWFVESSKMSDINCHHCNFMARYLVGLVSLSSKLK